MVMLNRQPVQPPPPIHALWREQRIRAYRERARRRLPLFEGVVRFTPRQLTIIEALIGAEADRYAGRVDE